MEVVKNVSKPIKEVIEAYYYNKKSREDGRVTIPERFRNAKELLDIPFTIAEQQDFRGNLEMISASDEMQEALSAEITEVFERFDIVQKQQQLAITQQTIRFILEGVQLGLLL